MARSGLLALLFLCWCSQQVFSQEVAPRLTNQERAEKLALALRDARIKGKDITLEVNRGVVTLTGYVADKDHQKLAGEIASNLAGVTQVNNLLKIDNDASLLTNQERAEKIADSLREALKGSDIRIEVNGGRVELTGFVADANDQKLASEVASRMEGVTEVINLLKVESITGRSISGVEVSPDSNLESQPDTLAVQTTHNQTRAGKNPFAESSLDTSFMIPISMESSARLKKLLARQKKLVLSNTLYRIEVSANYQNETTPLYDIYCGNHRLAIVSRCGGSNFASFEGTILNSFQGGLYEWKSGETTGVQYECGERELLNLIQYHLDPGGFITSIYQSFETQPERFETLISRKDGVREIVLKKPYYRMHSIAVSDDPLWFHELTHMDEEGEPVKRIYSPPIKVASFPESVSAALKAVEFEPTKRSVFSLMIYP